MNLADSALSPSPCPSSPHLPVLTWPGSLLSTPLSTGVRILGFLVGPCPCPPRSTLTFRLVQTRRGGGCGAGPLRGPAASPPCSQPLRASRLRVFTPLGAPSAHPRVSLLPHTPRFPVAAASTPLGSAGLSVEFQASRGPISLRI